METIRIQPVQHRSLAETVSGRLASYILDGKFSAGEKLPPERELIDKFGISRSTLREALRALAENRLIEVRPGVGWFVRPIDRTNYAQATELALAHSTSGLAQPEPRIGDKKVRVSAPLGPKPLKLKIEKPLRIPDLKKDRLGTFDFISWWDRERVQSAKVLIAGAGALGNEVIKNLALMGIGHIFVIDFDRVEAANLSRSVLFREGDNGRPKAEIALARAKKLNPSIKVQYLDGNVGTQLGLGVIRRMDVVVGCLDNREARLALNRFCYWMDKPWVDGAIMELLGLVRAFVPGEGACYECTLTEQARREMSLRYSCPLLARESILQGKVPTTPTAASIVAGIQSQEALKLLHEMEVDSGKVMHFNGMTNGVHTTSYLPREDCESHWTYGEVIELPRKAETTTVGDLLRIARNDLGPEAIIELDQELVLSLECRKCNTDDELFKPVSEVSHESGICPTCDNMRTVNMTHVVGGDEAFLDRSLAAIGVPPLHILRAHNGSEYRFYELTGDLPQALHFSHFDGWERSEAADGDRRIRLGPEVTPKPEGDHSTARRRIVLND